MRLLSDLEKLEILVKEGLHMSSEFYLQVRNFIRYVLRKYVHTKVVTEDMLNDTYIRIVQALDYFDSDKSRASSFIYTVIRNCSVSINSKEKKERVRRKRNIEVSNREVSNREPEVLEYIFDEEIYESLAMFTRIQITLFSASLEALSGTNLCRDLMWENIQYQYQ